MYRGQNYVEQTMGDINLVFQAIAKSGLNWATTSHNFILCKKVNDSKLVEGILFKVKHNEMTNDL